MLCRYNFEPESAVFWESLHNLECAINRTCTQMEGKRDLFYNYMLATDPTSIQSQIVLVRIAKLPVGQRKLLQCAR